MSTTVAQNNVTSLHDYKVADISLALVVARSPWPTRCRL